MGVQTFETVDAAHEALVSYGKRRNVTLTYILAYDEFGIVERELLKELKPLGSARVDPMRACLPGTRTDIIGDILDWSQRQDVSEGLLWVHGHAGLGKSSIATSVCQRLNDKNLLAAEFFCKRDDSDRRNPQQVFTTIIYGLALVHRELAESVAAAIKKDPRLCSSPIPIQYDSLIEKPLQMTFKEYPSANFVVVVDALDECGDKDSRQQLLAYFLRMSKLVSWLKIIITSRPDTDIKSFFGGRTISGVSRKNLYDYNAFSDIESFIQQRMLVSDNLEHLPLNATSLLARRADGLFIWAKTACELILSDHDPRSLFDQIIAGTGLGEETSSLDTLYTTAIENTLGASAAKNTQHIQQYLGAIIVCSTRTPLSVASLCDLLDIKEKKSVLQSVVNSLGSVLYTDHTKGGVVRVYHHSFTDYMTTSAPPAIRVDMVRQNTKFARCCLEIMLHGLKFNLCGLETSHLSNDQVLNPDLTTRIHDATSLHLRYSCLYWTSHLTKADSGEVEDLLKKFLLQPTMLYWIEVLSLLGKLDVAMYSALELSKWSKVSNICLLFRGGNTQWGEFTI